MLASTASGRSLHQLPRLQNLHTSARAAQRPPRRTSSPPPPAQAFSPTSSRHASIATNRRPGSSRLDVDRRSPTAHGGTASHESPDDLGGRDRAMGQGRVRRRVRRRRRRRRHVLVRPSRHGRGDPAYLRFDDDQPLHALLRLALSAALLALPVRLFPLPFSTADRRTSRLRLTVRARPRHEPLSSSRPRPGRRGPPHLAGRCVRPAGAGRRPHDAAARGLELGAAAGPAQARQLAVVGQPEPRRRQPVRGGPAARGVSPHRRERARQGRRSVVRLGGPGGAVRRRRERAGHHAQRDGGAAPVGDDGRAEDDRRRRARARRAVHGRQRGGLARGGRLAVRRGPCERVQLRQPRHARPHLPRLGHRPHVLRRHLGRQLLLQPAVPSTPRHAHHHPGPLVPARPGLRPVPPLPDGRDAKMAASPRPCRPHRRQPGPVQHQGAHGPRHHGQHLDLGRLRPQLQPRRREGLRPAPASRLRRPACALDPGPRLRRRRSVPSVRRLAGGHDLADQPRLLHAPQCAARRGRHRREGPFTLPVLPLHPRRLVHLVLVPGLHLRRPLGVLLGLLDRAEQRRRQPALRRLVRPRHGHLHVRLEPDLVHDVAARVAVVGRGQRLRRVRRHVLDRRARHVLHQCLEHGLPPDVDDGRVRPVRRLVRHEQGRRQRQHELERLGLQRVLAALPSDHVCDGLRRVPRPLDGRYHAHGALLRQGHPAAPQERAARREGGGRAHAAHEGLPRGPGLVVPPLPRHRRRPLDRRRRLLGHDDAGLGRPRRHPHRAHLHAAGCVRVCADGSADVDQPHRRARRRLHHPRAPPRQHALQALWRADARDRAVLPPGPQARPLHEDPAARYVHSSNRRRRHHVVRSGRRQALAHGRRPRPLRDGPVGAPHLPVCWDVLLGFSYLGSHWSGSPVQRGQVLQRHPVLHARRRSPTRHLVAPRQAVPVDLGAVHQRPRRSHRAHRHSAGDGYQPLLVVHRRLHLSVPHASSAFQVVEQVQLHPVGRPRLGHHPLGARHLLHAAVAQGRLDLLQLVGQHGLHRDGRLGWHALQDSAARGIRPDDLVELVLISHYCHLVRTL